MIISKKYNNTQEFAKKILFFLWWPFGSFLYATFSDPKSKSSYLIYFLWGLLLCWSINYNQTSDFYIDFINVVNKFYDINISFHELINIIKGCITYQIDNGSFDFYNTIIYWITHQISSNYHLVFVIAGIPFSFCMLSSLKFITSDPKFTKNIYTYVLILIFIFQCPIFSIQNFRFATGVWICIVSILNFFLKKKYKYLILIFLLPYVHYSYYFFLIIFVFFLIIKKINYKNYQLLLLLSLPFAIIPMDFFYNIISNINLPLFLLDKGDFYLSSYANDNFGIYANGWLSYFRILQIILITFAGLYMLNYVNKNKVEANIKILLNFLCIFISIVNIFNVVPVLGTRFYSICIILCVFVWYKIFYPYKRIFFLILLFSCLISFLDALNIFLLLIDTDFFYSNLFSLIGENIGVLNYN